MTDRETKIELPEELPKGLPVPEDDGAADHLPGKRLPSVALKSKTGDLVELSALAGVTVAYCFPMMGRPDSEMPVGWDEIPVPAGAPRSLAPSAITTWNSVVSAPESSGSARRTAAFKRR